jgi:hypothetical protein
MIKTQEQECKGNSGFKFDNFTIILYELEISHPLLCWIWSHILILTTLMADQNETIVTKKKLAVPRSKSVLISLYMITQFTGMFLSQHGFALLHCCVQENTEDKFHKKKNF